MINLMKYAGCLPIALTLALAALPAGAAERRLTADWRFMAGELAGAEQLDFNDAAWRKVAVPHDWSIMDKADG